MSSFSDPQAVARYAEGPVKLVPGFHALQQMAVLLAEAVPPAGKVLVLGAGGGLELKVFAESHAGWRFVGVAGFESVELFYAAFTFKGWVAHAPTQRNRRMSRRSHFRGDALRYARGKKA